MHKRSGLLFLFVFLTVAGLSLGHINVDSIFFNPSYFQLKLDSMYLGHAGQKL